MPDVDEGDSRGELDLGAAPDFETDDDDLNDPTVAPRDPSSSSEPDWNDPFDQADEDEDDAELPAPAPAPRKGLALNQKTREDKLAAIRSADPEAVLDYAEGLRAATTKAQQETAELRRQTERDRNEHETRLAQLEARMASPKEPQALAIEEPDPKDYVAWFTWFQENTGENPTRADLLHAQQRFQQSSELKTTREQLKAEQEQRSRLQEARDAETLRSAWGDLVDGTPVLASATEEEQAVAAQAVASFMAEHNMPVTQEAVQQAFGAVMWPAFNAQLVAQQASTQAETPKRRAAAATPPPGGPARTAKREFKTLDDVAEHQKRARRR